MQSFLNDLWWHAATVLLEAEGEPDQGKLGVAFVIATRLTAAVRKDPAAGMASVVLHPLAFSCWNGNSPRRHLVANIEHHPLWHGCLRAAAAAYFSLQPDPTKAANHYLRSDLADKPSWFDPARVTVVIGHHSFLRLP